jgi:hypothetical protein
MINSIKLHKQMGRDLTGLFKNANINTTTTTNLKKHAILQAQTFVKDLLVAGRSPEQIIEELLLIAFDPINVVINQNLENRKQIELQIGSIQQLAQNESTFFGGIFARDLPRGFQNLLAYVYIAAHPQNAFCKNEKFNFTKFSDWITKIHPGLTSKLEASYFTNYSYKKQLQEYSIGNKDYNTKVTGKEFKLTPTNNSPQLEITAELLRELVKDKAGYEPFMTNLLEDLHSLGQISGSVVIGDLDGDIVRFILALAATGKITHITTQGKVALSKLIDINQEYYLGKFNAQTQKEVFKRLQLAQAEESLIHELTQSLTHANSETKLIMIGDIFFDRMSNFDALIRLIKDTHEYNSDSLVNIIGNHEAEGLEQKMTRSPDKGSHSYTYFHKTQYRDFLNKHFDFIYYEADKKTVYSHTLFDTSEGNEKGLKYYTVGNHSSSSSRTTSSVYNDLKYLGQVYLLSETTDPNELFGAMNNNLKQDYLQNNIIITYDQVNFTTQGRLSYQNVLFKLNKIKLLLNRLDIKSVFGHDSLKLRSDNLIGVNRYLNTGDSQAGFDIAYHIINPASEEIDSPLTFKTLSRDRDTKVSLSEVNDHLQNLLTENTAEKFANKLVEFLNNSIAQEIQLVYLSKFEGTPSTLGKHEFLLVNAHGQEFPFIIEIDDSNIDKLGEQVRILLEALKHKTQFEIKLSELCAKQNYLFEKALKLFKEENDQYSLSLDDNELTINNGEKIFNFTGTITLIERVNLDNIYSLITDFSPNAD